MEKNSNCWERFSEIEQAALSGRIPMTLEILKKCFITCFYTKDDEAYEDIKKRFPELTDTLGWEKPYLSESNPSEKIPLRVYDTQLKKFITIPC